MNAADRPAFALTDKARSVLALRAIERDWPALPSDEQAWLRDQLERLARISRRAARTPAPGVRVPLLARHSA
jgi:hypothetical protein